MRTLLTFICLMLCGCAIGQPIIRNRFTTNTDSAAHPIVGGSGVVTNSDGTLTISAGGGSAPVAGTNIVVVGTTVSTVQNPTFGTVTANLVGNATLASNVVSGLSITNPTFVTGFVTTNSAQQSGMAAINGLDVSYITYSSDPAHSFSMGGILSGFTLVDNTTGSNIFTVTNVTDAISFGQSPLNGNGVGITNTPGNTVTSSNSTVTIAPTKNPNGTSNFDLSVSASGGSQTPWTNNVNGSNFALTNVNAVNFHSGSSIQETSGNMEIAPAPGQTLTLGSNGAPITIPAGSPVTINSTIGATNVVTMTNLGNIIGGSFTGNGGGLTNLFPYGQRIFTGNFVGATLGSATNRYNYISGTLGSTAFNSTTQTNFATYCSGPTFFTNFSATVVSASTSFSGVTLAWVVMACPTYNGTYTNVFSITNSTLGTAAVQVGGVWITNEFVILNLQANNSASAVSATWQGFQ